MDPIYLSSLSNATYDLSLLSAKWQAGLVILYSSTAIISFTSNLLAIFIILNRDRLNSEIWKYLMNLSIADVFMALFCIPFTYTTFMLGRWIFPTWLCPIVQLAQHCSVFVSVYTLTIIGFDRYFAIVYPFHKLNYLKTHKIRVLAIIWLIGLLFSSIQMLETQAVPFQNGNETYYDCKELWDDNEGKYYTIFIFVITFALPVCALVFVYTSIGFHIIRQTAPGNPDRARDSIQWNIKIKVIKMLITIVILFIICWLPLQLFGFLVWFYPPNINNVSVYMFYVVSYFVCHWLAMAHSFLNPFIYGFMSENFKISLQKAFCHWHWRKQQRDSSHSKVEAELEKLSNLTNLPPNSGAIDARCCES